MESPESWVWIWLIAAVLFAVAEMSSPGSFFLLPFAAGALAASGAAFLEAGSVLEWIVFIGISAASFLALRPLARRLDSSTDDQGIGSRRLIGQTAVVTQAIPERGELGIARVHREDWRAESLDGTPIPEGTRVRVAEVEGTRVMVVPVDQPPPSMPPDTTPPTTPSQGADL